MRAEIAYHPMLYYEVFTGRFPLLGLHCQAPLRGFAIAAASWPLAAAS